MAIALGIGRFGYTPMLPAMQAGGGLTLEAAGGLASLNFVGYLVGAFAAAAVPRGAVRSWVFRLVLTASLATTAGMATIPSVPLWGALRLLSGVASGGVFVLSSAIVLDRLASQGRSHLAWVHFAGIGTGIALSTFAIVVLGLAEHWRQGWLALGATGLVLSVPCWPGVQDRPEPAAPAASSPSATPRRSGIRWLFLALVAAYFFEGAGYIVTGTFLVAIVKSTAGLEPLAGTVWIVVGLAAAPSCWLWLKIAGRLGELNALIACFAVQALGIALPLVSASAAAALGGAVLFGGTFLAIAMLMVGYGSSVSGLARGPAVSLMTVSFSLGQMLGPLMAARLAAGPAGFAPALEAAAALVVLGIGLMVAGRALDRRREAEI